MIWTIADPGWSLRTALTLLCVMYKGGSLRAFCATILIHLDDTPCTDPRLNHHPSTRTLCNTPRYLVLIGIAVNRPRILSLASHRPLVIGLLALSPSPTVGPALEPACRSPVDQNACHSRGLAFDMR